MKTLSTMIAGAALCGAATLAQAADNPLSVHVLNIQTGQPSAGVEVVLERQTDSGWEELAVGTTAESGRISALFPEGEAFEAGVYRVTFETGETEYLDAALQEFLAEHAPAACGSGSSHRPIATEYPVGCQ